MKQNLSLVFPQVVRTGDELKRMVAQRNSPRIISRSMDGWFIGKKTFKKTCCKGVAVNNTFHVVA